MDRRERRRLIGREMVKDRDRGRLEARVNDSGREESERGVG